MKKILILIAMCAAVILGGVGLSACTGRTEYSVSCQDCENGYVILSDTRVAAGEKVILAAHPDAGYKLAAFLLDGEEIGGVSFVMPEKDVTVSARFEVVTYSVTYVLGDATAGGSNPDSYTVESAAELIAPEKEGYEICGWYRYFTETEYDFDIEDYRVATLDGLSGNLTLYAKYYNPLHRIDEMESINGWFYVNDNSGEARYGDMLDIIANPYLGYELDYITVNGKRIDGTTFAMPAADVEINAYFKPVEYEITYVLNGGTNSPDNPDYYTVEDGYITLHDAEKDGYAFYGWYYDEECSWTCLGIDANERRPITLYACFVIDVDDEE